MSVCLPACLSVCLSVCLSACLSVCLCLFLFLSLSLSLSHTLVLPLSRFLASRLTSPHPKRQRRHVAVTQINATPHSDPRQNVNGDRRGDEDVCLQC